MFHYLWDTILYKPLINALAFLVSVVPGSDIGIAVILLTILVKLLLFPFSQKAIKNQAAMAILAPEIEKIKKGGGSKEEQARLTFELYKKHKTNPFSGCLLVLIQIPIIFALYYVFFKGINFQSDLLYSFVHIPEEINMNFLGVVDLGSKSLILAILAGASQYLQAHFMPKPKITAGGAGSFAESFAKSMHMQMKYIFPFLVAWIAYSISGAVALYWIVSNIFAVLQQIYVNKTERKALTEEAKILIKDGP
ncbi:membrane protein insertase YidC [Candidatus Nomurabacteria bacterium]|nr:membrane protein insertase YidC [Candidatus Nomurabacteria bacterium]